jgi:hypothetical protein
VPHVNYSNLQQQSVFSLFFSINERAISWSAFI